MKRGNCVSVMGLVFYLYLVSAYFRARSYRCSNGILLIVTLLLVLWSGVTVTADELPDFDLMNLSDSGPENTSTPQKFYAVVLPNFNYWHILLMVLSLILILSCCAFCTYYPFALLQQ